MMKRNKKSYPVQPPFAVTPRQSIPDAGAAQSSGPNRTGSAPRHDGWTPERQKQFCAELAETGIVEKAAVSVGLSRTAAYALRRRDADFAARWDAARHSARQALVDVAIDLAFQGRIVKIIEQGKVVGERRRNSPALVLRAIKRTRSKSVLGNPTVVAASRRFHHCLDLLEKGIAFPNPDGGEVPPVESCTHLFGWPPLVQRAFCEALAQCGTVAQACAAIGKPRSMAYATRHHPAGKAFAIAWDAALLFSSEHLLDLAMDLAKHGSIEQVTEYGKIVRERRTICPLSMLRTAVKMEELLAPIRWHADKSIFEGAEDFEAKLDLLESGELQRRIEARDAAAASGMLV